MRCTQIKQHLSNPESAMTDDLTRHIRVCTDCRREWDAEMALRCSVGAVRNEPQVSKMGTASAWVERVTSEHEELNMSSVVRHPFGTPRRRWGWTISAVAVALAFFVLVPFSYHHTIGTEIVIPTTANVLQQVDQAELESRLADNGYSSVQLSKSVTNGSATLTLSVPGSSTDALAVVDIAKDLLPAPIADAELQLKPWRVVESGSLLAQMTNTFTISVDTDGKTETQIADEIRAQLESQGMQVKSLWISQDGSGSTTMSIESGSPDSETEDLIELKMNNDAPGSGGNFSTTLRIDDLDPNLSDQEKLDEITRRLQAEGIYDANVTVNGDDVKIELLKDE